MSKLTVCNECEHCQIAYRTEGGVAEGITYVLPDRFKCAGIRNFVTGEKNAGVFFCKEINRDGKCKFFEVKKEDKASGVMVPDKIEEVFYLTQEEADQYDSMNAGGYYVACHGVGYKITGHSWRVVKSEEGAGFTVVLTRKLVRV